MVRSAIIGQSAVGGGLAVAEGQDGVLTVLTR